MKDGGVLEAAQNVQRLHKVDGHFYLEAQAVPMNNGQLKTIWSVDSIYDFEPFRRQGWEIAMRIESPCLRRLNRDGSSLC